MYSLTKRSSLLSEDRARHTPLNSTIKHRMYSRLEPMKIMRAMEFLSGIQMTGLNITCFSHLKLIRKRARAQRPALVTDARSEDEQAPSPVKAAPRASARGRKE
jgi:hypothetical protein